MRPIAALVVLVVAGSGVAQAASASHWSFENPFGSFDLASAQRGYAVYAGACASCHSMKQLTFRDLGGLGLDADQIRRIAAAQMLPGGTDANGEEGLRPATPDDHFRQPYANDAAARTANHGALPPDQSRIAITVPGGAGFIDAYLNGYRDPPPGTVLAPGMFYNVALAGNATAMPPPLHDGQIQYSDGTNPTATQMAKDVSTYLAWAAQPHLVERRRLGVRVLLYLLLLVGLLAAFKRKVWKDV